VALPIGAVLLHTDHLIKDVIYVYLV